jgi:hypothetical protein
VAAQMQTPRKGSVIGRDARFAGVCPLVPVRLGEVVLADMRGQQFAQLKDMSLELVLPARACVSYQS